MAKVNKEVRDEEAQWVTRSGAVISEEIAEEMAAEIERGEDLDPSKWRRQYVGRPSLGASGRSPRVSFRVSPEVYKAAWKRADEEGRSLSDLAREALRQYLGS